MLTEAKGRYDFESVKKSAEKPQNTKLLTNCSAIHNCPPDDLGPWKRHMDIINGGSGPG